jgi:SAM-dependent methyltransferase
VVTRRIESEKNYHKRFYTDRDTPLEVDLALATSVKRKPHNLYWAYYDTILDYFHRDLTGKKVLVVGCGTGMTPLNLAVNGAKVDAFDLCEEAIAICKRRAEFNRINGVNFFVSSCEELELTGDCYDAVVGEMILHHIDIPIAVEKFYQLLKEGGLGVFEEWKVYPILDRIRSLRLFKRLFPPGGVDKYATEYERKLSKEDLQIIRARFPDMHLDYRYCMVGKINYFKPAFGARVQKLDYLLLRVLPIFRPFTDGVIIRFTKGKEEGTDSIHEKA